MNNTAIRATLAGLALIAALALGWFGHKVIDGAPDIATVSLYQDWRLACPPTSQKDGSCEMQQEVLDAKTHSELARLSIFGVNADATLLVTVPFNVLLEPGLGLGIDDDKPLVLQYETCNGVGCMARVKFDDALRTKLGKAAKARVLVVGLDAKAVGLPFSVKGYKEAMAAFDSAEAKRRSWWWRLWS